MATGIAQTMAHWAAALEGSDAREVVRTYAEQKGARLSEIDAHRVRIDTTPGDYVFVDFDESGHLCGIELPQRGEPAPRRASWLGRLLRGKGR
jgi:uncharacterized protein YuzE